MQIGGVGHTVGDVVYAIGVADCVADDADYRIILDNQSYSPNNEEDMQ